MKWKKDGGLIVATGLFGQYHIAPSDSGFTVSLMSGGNIRNIGQCRIIALAKDMAAYYDAKGERHARAVRPRRHKPKSSIWTVCGGLPSLGKRR
jgi:hypothetical protein